jgi:plastocyanin
VIRRAALACGLATLAALTAAPAAFGQGAVVQAVDQSATTANSWSPQETTIRQGETVTWTFAGTQGFHNVANKSANWDFRSGEIVKESPPASYTFSTPGTYEFHCEAHKASMTGTIVVTDPNGNPPPPPPPPPLSEQPFPNDAAAPSFVEIADTLRPRLTRMRVRPRRHAARVRFRLDEPALVTVRVQRARLTVKRSRALFLKGTRTLTVRRLRPGAYRVAVFARDFAGNRSPVKRARVTVR